jgi:hypothetical protein
MARLIKSPGQPDRYEYTPEELARIRAWQKADALADSGQDGSGLERQQAQRNRDFMRSERYP